ncbi:SrtB family sortase [Paenibacillus marchantiophytorum]|uniref:SrtB family sortase n=1 Tax=Paenibacillus marchantiophytorum TaxID=1619310 RepID=A0ABQ1EKA8_9BACL|nr:class B sortase [Paenibacillus marchantiophytorum]GFZ75900.1 SrtB family sortase [Paenibacillus marchantiophytorum]
MHVLRIAWIAAAAAVCLYAVLRLTAIGWGYYENREVLAEIRDVYKEAQSQEAGRAQSATESVYGKDHETVQQVRVGFEALLKLNPDFTGWIKLKGSHIDYPVMQGNDNKTYLNRNAKGESSRAGSIFMDYRNEPDSEQRHLILYGHRMKDGTMFGDLKHFVDESYYLTHRQFRFDTLTASYAAEVFSAYDTTTDFNYIETDFADEEAFRRFLKKIQGKSLFASDMTLTSKDRILTLSTCDYLLDPVNGRFVIHARLKRLD